MFWPVALYTEWWCGPHETHRPHFIPRDAQTMLHTKKPLLFPFHHSTHSLRPLLTVPGQFRPLPWAGWSPPLAGASPDSRSLWSSDTVPRNLSCWKGHFPIPGLARFQMQLWLSLALLVASRSQPSVTQPPGVCPRQYLGLPPIHAWGSCRSSQSQARGARVGVLNVPSCLSGHYVHETVISPGVERPSSAFP